MTHKQQRARLPDAHFVPETLVSGHLLPCSIAQTPALSDIFTLSATRFSCSSKQSVYPLPCLSSKPACYSIKGRTVGKITVVKVMRGRGRYTGAALCRLNNPASLVVRAIPSYQELEVFQDCVHPGGACSSRENKYSGFFEWLAANCTILGSHNSSTPAT